MVSVIGDHAATAIANAQMYERMEMLDYRWSDCDDQSSNISGAIR